MKPAVRDRMPKTGQEMNRRVEEFTAEDAENTQPACYLLAGYSF